MTITIEASPLVDLCVERKSYRQPKLVGYGSVAILTKSGASGVQETSPPSCNSGPSQAGKSLPCVPSDIRCKHNVVHMGTHASGFGLYMYDYLPEFTDRMGDGKFFGVMAQEVLLHNPSAVMLEASGYYAVNYSALESATVQ